MKERNYKAEVIVFILAIPLILIILYLIWYCQQNKIRKEYLEKGIYEVEGNFGLGANGFLSTVFMICEPPSDRAELERVVINFIEENDIVQTLKARSIDWNGAPTQLDALDITQIDLYFVEPSRDYPIGFDNGYHNGFFSGFITDHTIIEVRIPWDSTGKSDFSFIYWH